MTKQIKQYYQERLKQGDANDLLWQVGKTVNGVAVSQQQINLILKTINEKLHLAKNDTVLDIGCANGLLTKQIAQNVYSVTGIELTAELLDVATRFNGADNIAYLNCNILEVDINSLDKKFSKIVLYEVFQHFDYKQADMLFSNLAMLSESNGLIFIGGILDVEKKWDFFNTKERRIQYFSTLLDEGDALGTWYHKDFIQCLAKKHNMKVECFNQNNGLYTAHYRFDCVLSRI